MRLEALIRGLDLPLRGNGQVEITHITHDSRKVEPGSLFVALEGKHFDGHTYLGRAAQLGAVAVLSGHPERVHMNMPCIVAAQPRRSMAQLARRLFGAPDTKLKVIGVTGTNGKTTSCFLLGQMLEQIGLCGRMGTLSYFNGVSEERAHRTTPESSEIYMTLNEMVKNCCQFAAIEISSHAMMFDRVFGMELTYGLFTNLSQDHLDFHGDMESYFQAKQLMFELLKPGSIAIVNADDAYGKRIRVPEGVILKHFGGSANYDLFFDDLTLTARFSEFSLHYKGEAQSVRLPLLGMHNVYNFMGAALVALEEGLSLAEVARLARTLKAVSGRMETVAGTPSFQVVVDFAHSPDALEKVVSCCKSLTKGRLILVFGAGGDRDKEKRPLMGAVADKYADVVVLTSDNPRSEAPESIMDMVARGINRHSDLIRQADRYKAIEYALSVAREDDLVLIAGKGHETHQEIAGEFFPFNDREVTLRILRRMEAKDV
ncbi:MAG: UDP-N-acetylmuramoyl-L-alanyl-D-glutamate--2,6-diaminopimelate ligase [Acidobacteria bacterium]|nr:UDP-N-acetylmuramoyl-L-alanyl-D-glutamate--2,6-diaminopimelate ligase [Acidobacteriota bacterium]